MEAWQSEQHGLSLLALVNAYPINDEPCTNTVFGLREDLKAQRFENLSYEAVAY